MSSTPLIIWSPFGQIALIVPGVQASAVATFPETHGWLIRLVTFLDKVISQVPRQ